MNCLLRYSNNNQRMRLREGCVSEKSGVLVPMGGVVHMRCS